MRFVLVSLLVLLAAACGRDEESQLKLDPIAPPDFMDRTLDRVSFLTAHNAFAHNQGQARFLVPNQDLSIAEQLKMGVRGFMLDIWSRNGEAVLCHGTCGLPGLFPAISLTDELRHFQEFMKKNPEALITFHLEWTPSAKAAEFEAALNSFPELQAMIFDPYAWQVKRKGWPKVGEMIAQNKRLLILSQSPVTQHLGVGYDRDFTVENYWSLGGFGKDRACRSRWDESALDEDRAEAQPFRRLFVMNHFRDIATSFNAATDNARASLWGRVTHECLAAARRIPNYIALDFVGKGAATETLASLNRAIGIAFEHSRWQGQAELIMPGAQNLESGDGKLGDDRLSSIEIFFKGTRVSLFGDRDQKAFLLDVVESSSGFSDAVNDKVSSWRVGD